MADAITILQRLPGGYLALFDRAVAVLEGDGRVRGLWLSGSLARGTADAASDLDLLVAIADESYEEFALAWREWLGEITPTVLAGELPFARGSFWSITPGFERFDVVTEPVSGLASSPFRARVVVFDRDELTERIPPASSAGASASVAARLVEDWFHFSAMLETVLWRRDWLLGTEHLHFLRGLLYQLYVASNQPLPPMGTKQWSAKLTDDQRSVLEELPTAVIDAESLVHAHLAYARAFLPVARSLAADIEFEWPDELESAATRHLRAVLDIDEPYPA